MEELICAMVYKARRRRGLPRFIKVFAAFIAVTLVCHYAIALLGNGSPLEFQNNASGHILQEVPLQQLSEVSARQPQQLIPCKLHRLQDEANRTRGPYAVQPQCKRLEPIPGSCQTADKLFHSRPPTTCGEPSFEFCTLTVRHELRLSIGFKFGLSSL